MFFPFRPVSYSGWRWPSNKTIIYSVLWILTDTYRYPSSPIPLHPSRKPTSTTPLPRLHDFGHGAHPTGPSQNSEVNTLLIPLGSVGKVPKGRKAITLWCLHSGCLSAMTEVVRAASASSQRSGNLPWVRYPVSYLNLGPCQAHTQQGPCLWMPSLNSSITFLVFAGGKTALVCGLSSSENLRIGHGEPEIERRCSLEKMENADSKTSLEYFFFTMDLSCEIR